MQIYQTEYVACDHVVQMKYEKSPKYNVHKMDTCLIESDYKEDSGYYEECREKNEGKENAEGKGLCGEEL